MQRTLFLALAFLIASASTVFATEALAVDIAPESAALSRMNYASIVTGANALAANPARIGRGGGEIAVAGAFLFGLGTLNTKWDDMPILTELAATIPLGKVFGVGAFVSYHGQELPSSESESVLSLSSTFFGGGVSATLFDMLGLGANVKLLAYSVGGDVDFYPLIDFGSSLTLGKMVSLSATAKNISLSTPDDGIAIPTEVTGSVGVTFREFLTGLVGLEYGFETELASMALGVDARFVFDETPYADLTLRDVAVFGGVTIPFQYIGGVEFGLGATARVYLAGFVWGLSYGLTVNDTFVVSNRLRISFGF